MKASAVSAVSDRNAGPVPAVAPAPFTQKPPIRKTITEAEMADATPVEDVAEPAAAAPAERAPEVVPHPAPVMRQGGPHGMMNGRPPQISRASNKDETFAEGDHVVYPTHGVGRVEKIAVEEIAGHKLELIHITFEENRMTLRVPVAKARSAGLRKLATRKLFDEALAVLKGKARIKRTMWSRRAQEYEAKINSGDPLAIAEVVRDLHRNAGQPDQSFSERQIYEAAMDRLAAELAALDETDKMTAVIKLTNYIKTPV
jgi:CarD family transcriptional regulator